MTDALAYFKNRVGQTLNGSFVSLLNENTWRFDLIQDPRFKQYKTPVWEYKHWSNFFGNPDEHVILETREVRGFLKAKFPDKDVNQMIVDAVRTWIQRELK
jgi:hypothetical protein